MNWKYPLAHSSWGEEEIEAACKVIKSGKLTMGEKTLEFEEAFAKTFGVKHAVFVNSGSSANLLSVASQFYIKDHPLRAGDEVLVPAVAWGTTYFPLHQYGLRIKLVDIDLDTLDVDVDELRDRITHRTKALVAVNLLGNPCEWEWMPNLLIIEDNCEGMGAYAIGEGEGCTAYFPCGTNGKVGTFSTFFSHHICTGEGGVVVTNDEETAQIVRCLRSHGWTRDLPDDNFVAKKGEDGWQERYRFVLPGYNLRPTEVAAAIGIEQLKRLPAIITMRRANAATFKALLAELNRDELLMTGQQEVGRSSWYGFALVLRGRLDGRRKELVEKLMEAGIETRPVMSGNFARHEAAWKMGLAYCVLSREKEISFCPNADYLDRNGMFLGNAAKDLTDELEQTFKTIKEFCK